MADHQSRLQALRAELSRSGLDGFIVPLADEHLGEYVGAYARRLEWLTGFDGSAGTAIILPGQAALFVDGRYEVQAQAQVGAGQWSVEALAATDPVSWMAERTSPGARIGYDPWLHAPGWIERAREALNSREAALVPLSANPIDALWADRPAPSAAPLQVHPDRLAGRSSAEKRREIAGWLAGMGADAVVLTALDSIAWTFNLRGADVHRTPFALAFALVHGDGAADLFVAPEKMTPEVSEHLGEKVRVRDRADFSDELASFSGKRVAADPERAVAAIFEALEAGGASIVKERDPTVLPRATKNEVEKAGARAAHRRDGEAVTRFLHWLSSEAPKGNLTEQAAADRLLDFRQRTGCLRDLSFDTISGAGPNGAIPHYRLTRESNRAISPGSLYLVDSGGQYPDGTTDITRTIAVGTPSAEMQDRFTRVLQGHVALATALFPDGTRGAQLDTLARQFLWAAGLDYPHGTGHGVGSYLGVHEGPQRIAPPGWPQSGGDEPLRAGMILSNEPGYYKAGAFGIRIENLVLVEERRPAGAERPMLGFETLTLAPIDRNLIECDMLSPAERGWIDDYHARVLKEIGPGIEGEARAWLQEACAPLPA